jgi:predicted ribosome quality control (RQC) complex YloA/Tae2 family protein
MKEFFDENKTVYWLGRNAQDNWDIIKKAEKNWLWIHLDKFPSGHVIICKDFDTVTKEELNYGCMLCLDNSKYKIMRNIGIVYTEIKNLKRGFSSGSIYFISNHKINNLIIR